jgi:hypothetical protein
LARISDGSCFPLTTGGTRTSRVRP